MSEKPAAGHIAAIEDKGSAIPEAARPILSLLVEQLRALDMRAAELDREIARRAREDAEARRLMTIPGIGPNTATAMPELTGEAIVLRHARRFAAEVVAAARQRLETAGVDIAALPADSTE